jgi:hypothetical protein
MTALVEGALSRRSVGDCLSLYCHRHPVPVDGQVRTIPARNPGRCTPAKVHIATTERLYTVRRETPAGHTIPCLRSRREDG